MGAPVPSSMWHGFLARPKSMMEIARLCYSFLAKHAKTAVLCWSIPSQTMARYLWMASIK